MDETEEQSKTSINEKSKDGTETLESFFGGRDTDIINVFFKKGAGWKRFNRSSIMRLLNKNELVPESVDENEVFSYITENEYESKSSCRYAFEQDTLKEDVYTFIRTYDSDPICRAVNRFEKIVTRA